MLCAIFIYCSTKKSRQHARDERFKKNLGIYIGDVASREAGANNKGTVNLDDVTEQTLPMLSNTSTAQDLRTVSNVTNASGNEASSELSDHVSTVQEF